MGDADHGARDAGPDGSGVEPGAVEVNDEIVPGGDLEVSGLPHIVAPPAEKSAEDTDGMLAATVGPDAARMSAFSTHTTKSLDPAARPILFLDRRYWSRHPFDSIVTVRTATSIGSGFSIGNGYIVTASHVVANASGVGGSPQVLLPGSGERFDAHDVWLCRRLQHQAGNRITGDIAVLRISRDVPALELYFQHDAAAWATVPTNKLRIIGVGGDVGDRIILSPGSFFGVGHQGQHRENLFYVANTLPGESGAAVSGFLRSGRRVLVSAVHVADRAVRNPPGKNHAELLRAEEFAWVSAGSLPDPQFWDKVQS